MLAANLSDLLQGPARRERPRDCTYRLASSARSSLVRGPPSLYSPQSRLLRCGPVSATRSCLKNRGNRARRAHAQRAGVQVQQLTLAHSNPSSYLSPPTAKPCSALLHCLPREIPVCSYGNPKKRKEMWISTSVCSGLEVWVDRWADG